MNKSQALRNFYENCHVHCSNLIRGCTFVSKGKQMPVHESYCEYKEIKCYIKHKKDCSWSGLLRDFQEHCRLNHRDSYSIEKKETVRVTNFNDQNLRTEILFFCYKKMFLHTISLDVQKGLVLFKVLFLGPSNNTECYYFKIKSKSSYEKLSFITCCVHDGTLAIPYKNLKTFCKRDNIFCYKLSIRKRKRFYLIKCCTKSHPCKKSHFINKNM